MKDDGPIDKMHESGSFFYNQFPPNNIQIIERNQFSKERVNVKFTDSSPLLIQMGKFIQRLIVWLNEKEILDYSLEIILANK